jgi:glyoxylase-like metal-dependent hydrolase (beta-lactamase superfamily II)
MALLRQCLQRLRMKRGEWEPYRSIHTGSISGDDGVESALHPLHGSVAAAAEFQADGNTGEADRSSVVALDDGGARGSPMSLAYPCGEPPAPGAAREVAPGVAWLRMPIMGNPSHINLWAVRDGERWDVVDTGMQTLQTLAAWEKLAGPDGLFGEHGPRRAFVTHMHPDHIGMAGWLARQYNCTLWMTRGEYLSSRILVSHTDDAVIDEAARFYRRAGWDAQATDRHRMSAGNLRKIVTPFPASYRRLRDGERVTIGGKCWQVVVGSGHSPEHACFYCAELGVFISGDQVLPRISSNVSVSPTEPEADPLADWLSSIEKIRQSVPANVLVLPAHGEPFHGLHERLDRLAASRHRTLERLRGLLAREPRRAIDVFASLFARAIDSDPFLLRLATGESLAYLNHLVQRGEVSATDDIDGVAWYRLR